MKTMLFATATAVLFSTAAFAGPLDFEATQLVTTFESGNLELSLGTVDGDLDSVTTTARVAEYSLGRFDTTTDIILSYGRLSDTLSLGVEYGAETSLNGNWDAYGSATLAYVAPTGALGNGDAVFTPELGARYVVNKKLDTFADVQYSWNLSGGTAYEGGIFEVGVDYYATESITLTPSLVRTFDTGADATNVKLEAAFRF